MMKDTIPKRDDKDNYLKLDEIEKYAFTHTITYELARRNMNVSNILNLFFDVFSFYE